MTIAYPDQACQVSSPLNGRRSQTFLDLENLTVSHKWRHLIFVTTETFVIHLAGLTNPSITTAEVLAIPATSPTLCTCHISLCAHWGALHVFVGFHLHDALYQALPCPKQPVTSQSFQGLCKFQVPAKRLDRMLL